MSTASPTTSNCLASSQRWLAVEARLCNNFRSSSTCSTAPGRRTLTTTSVSSCKGARWACPMEAAASGVESKVAKACSSGCPSVAVIISRTVSTGIEGAASCSLANSIWYSLGNRSVRDACYLVLCYSTRTYGDCGFTFLKEVEESILRLLQAQNRCFVLILANVDGKRKPYQISLFSAKLWSHRSAKPSVKLHQALYIGSCALYPVIKVEDTLNSPLGCRSGSRTIERLHCF
jgi:hypothetical protein